MTTQQPNRPFYLQQLRIIGFLRNHD